MDPAKYLDRAETTRLRESAELHARQDEAKGNVRGPLSWLLVDLALSTGLRVSELILLKWDDVDARKKSLRVPRHKRRKPTFETIPISDALLAHLEHARQTAKGAIMLTGQVGPLTRGAASRRWNQACLRAGVRASGIHTARHTLGTQLYALTKNLRLVQKALGHTRVDTTAIYADVPFEDWQAGINGVYK